MSNQRENSPGGLIHSSKAKVSSIFKSVIRCMGFPFRPKTGADIFDEEAMQLEKAIGDRIQKELAESLAKGIPIARFDPKLRKVYLEHPDGRREYKQ